MGVVNGMKQRRMGGGDIIVSEMGLGTQRWGSADFNGGDVHMRGEAGVGLEIETGKYENRNRAAGILCTWGREGSGMMKYLPHCIHFCVYPFSDEQTKPTSS